MTAMRHRTVRVNGLDVFYREAGDPSAPTLVLLHGFPTSSVAYRTLMEDLADEFHLVAPDYPGFGLSSAPAAHEWEYTFDRLADVVDALLDELGVTRYAVYVHDYGAPVGFRLALRHPERITGIVTQNGNAYEEGLTPFWKPIRDYWADPSKENGDALRGLLTRDATHWQYTHGVPDASLVDPALELHDQALLDRPGNQEIQLALFLDYGTNPPQYSRWQEYLRAHRPPLLAVWGRNDEIFGPDGARAFARDLPDARIHLLDAGHFPLTTRLRQSAGLIRDFLRGLSD
ncbi:alpha/beta hydrolase [Actinomadura kijaniata]|uniref:Pimeloyl-ACP methyl ester carboxylesterase n=1 Tax=Actinomadura namibiensis TaxID=182080 RepID=A0A7W3LLG9_ACTNM|nr:alpha/beta hydrolase [Actinomadura namibiensis]MBA8950315.1 pimeloyl-ACP methyl ester carboxylesterase [Actinomadura namibiensis]